MIENLFKGHPVQKKVLETNRFLLGNIAMDIPKIVVGHSQIFRANAEKSGTK